MSHACTHICLFSTHACEEEEGGSALIQNKAETFTDMCVRTNRPLCLHTSVCVRNRDIRAI